jgi:hypothetical protein
MAKRDESKEKPKKILASKKSTKPKRPPPPHLKEYNERKTAAFKEIMKQKEHKPIKGRPTIYNEELVNYIIRRVASSSMGLKDLCASDDKMPDHSTINEWRWDYPDFSSRYIMAKQHQTHLMGEDCEEIAKDKAYYHDASGELRVDPGHIASQRLMTETKRWHMSKLNPTFFGDRKAVEQLQSEHEQTKAELMAIKLQLAEVSKKEY